LRVIFFRGGLLKSGNKIKLKKMSNKQEENYRRQKIDFLDSLQPDDFRNGESFNQAEFIIDKINENAFRAALSKKDPQEFLLKAFTHLFREDSEVVKKAVNLANSYLEIYQNPNNA
jgi:hypothetical protein